MIRLTIPSIDQDDLDAVCEVLRSGYLVQGPRVAEFEGLVANYVGTNHAVAVANGTAALHLALLSLGVGPGDRVAVAAYSWPATANVIVLCGAEPLFVEVDDATLNLCPRDLERKLSATPVKAVLPVHAHGGIADMREIVRIGRQFDVPIVEDAACALGAALDGRKAGTWGRLGCFSFHPRKAITTGEGGLLSGGDHERMNLARSLRNHGLDPEAAGNDFVRPASNLRMTEFQAALGLSQLDKFERILAIRRAVDEHYRRAFAGTPVSVPETGPHHVLQSYVVQLPEGCGVVAIDLVARMKAAGVEASIGTWHMPRTSYYRSLRLSPRGFPRHRPGLRPGRVTADPPSRR